MTKRLVALLSLGILFLGTQFLPGHSLQSTTALCRIEVSWVRLITEDVFDRGLLADVWLWGMAAALSPEALQLAELDWSNETDGAATLGPVRRENLPTHAKFWDPKNPPMLMSQIFTESAGLILLARVSNLVEVTAGLQASFQHSEKQIEIPVLCSESRKEFFGELLHDQYIGSHEFLYRITITPVDNVSEIDK